jgi:hypothetical protein
MTKLLNIALMRQDFYHVIRRSYAVMQLCGSAVKPQTTNYNPQTKLLVTNSYFWCLL